MLKNLLRIGVFLIGIFILLYIISYIFLIPYLAQIQLPVRWKQLTVPVTKEQMENYLGDPALELPPNETNWIKHNNRFTYSLTAHYDTLKMCDRFIIRYKVHTFFYRRSGVVKVDSVR
jgi:hypothetical protein